MSESSETRERALFLGIFALALLLRLLHNRTLFLDDPLYYNPLGGHLPYLVMAEQIAGGDWLPLDHAFTVNSPLYPYLLAGLYSITGVNEFYGVRVFTAVLDSLTCVMVAYLAWRHFGTVGGAVAGVATAVCAPLVFFATDLTPVPFTLFMVVAALVLLDRAGPAPVWLAAGVLLGLASATRPNVLLAGVLALPVPWLVGEAGRRAAGGAGEGGFTTGRVKAGRAGAPLWGWAGRLRWTLLRPAALGRAALILLGVGLGVAPVTAANRIASGNWVLLTPGGGHNFYLGHNPSARHVYSIPRVLDEINTFESMRVVAERVEGRAMPVDEVSSYYGKRALAYIAAHPGEDLVRTGRKALALVGGDEFTTYANFYYQKELSPVLRWAPGLGFLIPLAVAGMLVCARREYYHLWVPVLTAAATVLLFFFISRLRVLMVPSLAFFAGAAVARGLGLLRARRWGTLGIGALAVVAGAFLTTLSDMPRDTSNEWNKAAGILRLNGRIEEAEAALRTAERRNPSNPDVHRNWAVLYRETGRPEEARRAEERARRLLEAAEVREESFSRELQELGAAR